MSGKKTFNPFPGLRPFSLEESNLFFGRSGQSNDIRDKLVTNKFVAVLGASGSGKSSLIYCGLVPLLQKNNNWDVVSFRPGTSPINNLVDSLIGSSNDKAFSKACDSLKTKTSSIAKTVLENRGDSKRGLLIIADQFEELFRYKVSSESTLQESETFVNLLVEASKDTTLDINVVITMRSDFIGECSYFQQLTDRINESNYLIPQMSKSNFREVITGPIAVGNGEIEESLVDKLVNDVGDNPDQLPILQHALMRTWDYWIDMTEGKRAISIDDYEAVGRMESALSIHANEAYEELSPELQIVCEGIFKTLSEKGADNKGIRHPESIETVASVVGATTEQVIEVANVFRAQGRSFLSPFGKVAINKYTVLDLSHESIMRIWARLSGWVDEESTAVQMYVRLAEAAELYQRGETSLWRPPDLQLAVSWREQKQPTLAWAKRYNSAFERAMVFLSTAEKEYEAEQANKLRQQKATLRRTRIFAMVLGSAAVIALILMLWAAAQRSEAIKQTGIAQIQTEEAVKARDEAEVQKTAAEKAQEEALAAKEEADAQKTLAEQNAETARKQEAIAKQQEAIAKKNADLAAENEKFALSEQDKAVKAAELAEERRQEADEQRQAALNLRMLSIAKTMAIKSTQVDQNLNLKSLLSYQGYLFNKEYQGEEHNSDIYNGLFNTKEAIEGDDFNILKAHNKSVTKIVVDEKKNKMFTGGVDGKLLMWNMLDDNSEPYTFKNEGTKVITMVLCDNNTKLAVSYLDKGIYIYDLNNIDDNPKKVSDLKNMSILAPISNGSELLCMGETSEVFKLNLGSLNAKLSFDLGFYPQSIDLSSDEKYLAISDHTGELFIYDIAMKEIKETLYSDSTNIIYKVKFTPDDNSIVYGDKNGIVRIKSLISEVREVELLGHNTRITAIQFSSDNRYLATAGLDGIIQLWLTKDYTIQPIVLKKHKGWVNSLGFISNGNKLISAGADAPYILNWETSVTPLTKDICSSIEKNFTQDEWNIYVGDDIEYVETCIK